jgi:hypothetical protein
MKNKDISILIPILLGFALFVFAGIEKLEHKEAWIVNSLVIGGAIVLIATIIFLIIRKK